MPPLSDQAALEALQIEEADAWFEYLEVTRGQVDRRYDEVEPWAWSQLAQRQRSISKRRRRLQSLAAA